MKKRTAVKPFLMLSSFIELPIVVLKYILLLFEQQLSFLNLIELVIKSG